MDRSGNTEPSDSDAGCRLEVNAVLGFDSEVIFGEKNSSMFAFAQPQRDLGKPLLRIIWLRFMIFS